MIRVAIAVFSISLVLFAEGCSRKKRPIDTDDDVNGAAETTAAPVKVKNGAGTFSIGKSTTHITGPLDKNGYVDYAAALDERTKKGVTPANNANVLLWQVIGPNSPPTPVPPGYLDRIGLTSLPPTGDYFFTLRKFVTDHLKKRPGEMAVALDKLKSLDHQPWTASQHPEIHGWLQANERLLKQVHEASDRTHFYSPLIPKNTVRGSGGLFNSPLPAAQMVRELATALATRAMLYTAHGQADAAWADLLACHRLARLIGQGGTLLEGLVGVAIEIMACRADVAFLDHARPDAARLGGYLRDLRALPPLPDFISKVDGAERFMYLDHVMQADRHGHFYLQAVNFDLVNELPSAGREGSLAGIDWDPVLLSANRWFDRTVQAMRYEDRRRRTQELGQIEVDLQALRKRTAGKGRLKSLTDKSSTARMKGEAMADVLISYMMPAVKQVQGAADRADQAYENVVVAFAIVQYQRETGRYPDRLNSLVPRYLKEPPRDLFSGRELLYRPQANGFLLYSVGEDGQDGGGRGHDDQPKGDDIVVRIPQAVPK